MTSKRDTAISTTKDIQGRDRKRQRDFCKKNSTGKITQLQTNLHCIEWYEKIEKIRTNDTNLKVLRALCKMVAWRRVSEKRMGNAKKF